MLLVDLGLPDGSGLELIRRARELWSDTQSLVISAFGDERSLIGALEAGARGYLLKSDEPADVRLAVAGTGTTAVRSEVCEEANWRSVPVPLRCPTRRIASGFGSSTPKAVIGPPF
jgi:DNA-binding NarL/FixJ family response regulator